MPSPRQRWRPCRRCAFRHTATWLPNGKVLVAGGLSDPAYTQWLNSVELFDPATKTWAPAAALTNGATATPRRCLETVEVRPSRADTTADTSTARNSTNPSLNTWSPAGSMASARNYHTATLLANGKVLVAGGVGTGVVLLSSAELYDPRTNTWSPAGSLATARQFHNSTLLTNGQVLVAGGTGVGGTRSPARSSTTQLPTVAGRPQVPSRQPARQLLRCCRTDECSRRAAATPSEPRNSTTPPPTPGRAAAASRRRAWTIPGHRCCWTGEALACRRSQHHRRCDRHRVELYNPATNLWSPAGAPRLG